MTSEADGMTENEPTSNDEQNVQQDIQQHPQQDIQRTAQGNGMRGFVLRLGSPAGVACVLTAIMAAYMTLVVFGNITDFDTNQEFVRHVLKMDTTFDDPDLTWRAIESTTLADIAYIGVIIWETLSAIVLWYGTWLLLRPVRGRAHADDARAISSLGLLMVLILFGFGFITVGGEWFAMWQSSDWNGLAAALRIFILAAFTLVVLHLPAKDRPDAVQNSS